MSTPLPVRQAMGVARLCVKGDDQVQSDGEFPPFLVTLNSQRQPGLIFLEGLFDQRPADRLSALRTALASRDATAYAFCYIAGAQPLLSDTPHVLLPGETPFDVVCDIAPVQEAAGATPEQSAEGHLKEVVVIVYQDLILREGGRTRVWGAAIHRREKQLGQFAEISDVSGGQTVDLFGHPDYLRGRII
jgi:hypothetical protein